MKLNEINIRDPFVLPYGDKYYMYGTRVGTPDPELEFSWGEQTGFDVYISSDLENWSEAKAVFEKNDDFWGEFHFWAPEVHFYNGKFYMLASFKAEGKCRATHILVSDTPDGIFTPVSKEPATPAHWECLDGTLYVDKEGAPHIVFCHEWLQIDNGTVCEMKLADDLSKPITEPRVLWSGADHPDVYEACKDSGHYITDGPYLYKCKNRDLISIWSSFGTKGYAELISKSDNGDIDGNWSVLKEPLWAENGGHGMLFEDYEGNLKFVMHYPNDATFERPVIKAVFDKDGNLSV